MSEIIYFALSYLRKYNGRICNVFLRKVTNSKKVMQIGAILDTHLLVMSVWQIVSIMLLSNDVCQLVISSSLSLTFPLNTIS